MCAAWLNSLGLLLDIVGVVLIFCFGLAPRVRDVLEIGNAANEAKKETRYIWLSRLGLAFIVIGFGFQIISNHL